MTGFEAYSYRTSSRFGNRVRVIVNDGTVMIAGPHVGLWTYRLWIVAQVILLWSPIPVLLAAAILWDWRLLTLALALLFAHLAVSGLGAGLLWAWADVSAFHAGSDPSVSFPVSAVKGQGVRIGSGWARNGLWLVIPHSVPGINALAKGRAVSFEAPAGDTGGDAVYALHMRTPEDAQALARTLEGAGSSTE